MALIVADRVMESSTTTGTGAFTLAGAYTGYRRFSAVCSVADTVYYCIEAVDANGNPSGDWETGLGTYSSANTLTRTTPSASSNSNNAVNFAAGTKRVMLDSTAAHLATFLGSSAIGSTVQAYDADLAALAGISPSQGDVIYHNGTQWTRLAAGTSGQFLQTQGSGANPQWGSGFGVLISEQSPSATGTVTFSSIASTYRDLRVVVRGRGDTALTQVGVTIRFNNDSGSNYDYERMGASSTTAVGVQSLAQTSIGAGFIPAASATASVGDAIDIMVHDYRGTTFQKSMKAVGGTKTNTTAGNISINVVSGWWRDASAINRVDVILAAGNFVSGSVVSLYGCY